MKRQRFSRLISMMLALVMMITQVPVSAFGSEVVFVDEVASGEDDAFVNEYAQIADDTSVEDSALLIDAASPIEEAGIEDGIVLDEEVPDAALTEEAADIEAPAEEVAEDAEVAADTDAQSEVAAPEAEGVLAEDAEAADADDALVEAADAAEEVTEAQTEEQTEAPVDPVREAALEAGAFTLRSGSIGGLTVKVNVPAATLPEGTEMTVVPVELDAAQAAVDNTEGVGGRVLAAVDITFFYNDEEIQPLNEVKVTIASEDLEDKEDLTVVHLDTKAEELEEAAAEAGDELVAAHVADIVEAEPVADVVNNADKVSFNAANFSIYAVVDPKSTEEEARATVNFWADTNKSEKRSTVYVKNSDTLEELETIIYDPGVGTLEEGMIFRGWTTDPNYTADTTPLTIAGVRAEMEAMSIAEGDVVDYYPIIFKLYNIAFQDEYGATTRTDKLFVRADEGAPSYTITESYIPQDPTKKFTGWYVLSGSDKVSPVQEIYTVGSTVTISGDVVFSVNAPSGAWLSFNENGKGASYTAPQFVESGAVTQRPANPTRKGYTFAGWYTGAPATEGGDPTGQQFTFGQKLTARQDLYAKWTPVATAQYTVLIWEQRATDDKNATDANKHYSVAKVYTLTGNVGSTINTVAATGANVNNGRGQYKRNIKVNNQEYAHTGFNCARYDQNVTIAAEGNTVLNVYYDRNLITIRFYDGSPDYYFNTGSGWTYDETHTGLFDAEIDFNWPSSRYNGYNIKNTLWKHSSNVSNANLTFYGSYKLYKPDEVTETLTAVDAGSVNIYFYKQNIDGTWPTENEASNVVPTNGGNFSFSNKYAGFTLHKYKNGDYVQDDSKWSGAQVGGNATPNGRLNIRFTRNKYSINYLDGTYFDGNGTVLQKASKTVLKTTEAIYYEADITSYGEGGRNYYKPNAVSGYTFAGWYIDETCTVPATFDTMPEGGMTVYAKWVQTQYRVFLHPNIPTTEDIEWGQTNQPMNFRVTSGDKISGGTPINGTREYGEYELIGWFTDPSLSNKSYFNFDTQLNDSTVTATPAYDKTKDFTDTMDEYGNITDSGSNGDVNRPWVTRKFELWAKWRKVLKGATGINVVYDATDEGTGAPNDTQLYLDNSDTIAQAASTPKDSTKQFKGWVLQTWDESTKSYKDKDGSIINPGDEFAVLKDDARQEVRLDDSGKPMKDEKGEQLYTYTVVLKAVYKDVEEPTLIDIRWYSNLQTTDGGKLELNKFIHTSIDNRDASGWYVVDKLDAEGNSDLEINEAVDIRSATTYSYPGLKFLGWAKEANATADNLFLKYNAEDDTFQAKVDGEWKTVTQVADDERTPHEDLYAVWQMEYFYIYHSYTCNVEAIPMTDVNEAGTYDLTEKVTSGNLYGGWYNSTGAATVTDDELTAAKNNNATVKETHVATSAQYTGQSLKNGTVKFWEKAKAGTVAGTAITPEANKVYYLKEVPTCYLKTNAKWVYDWSKDDEITDFYLITGLDDNLYKEYGFYIVETANKGKFTSAFSYQQRNSTTATVVKASELIGQNGYLAVVTATDKISSILAGTVVVKPYWKTLDGVTVTTAGYTLSCSESGASKLTTNNIKYKAN